MSDNKTEQPTDKKLNDARGKGQIAVSRDLARAFSLGCLAELALLSEPLWRGAVESLMALSLAGIDVPFGHALDQLLLAAGRLLLLVFAACGLLAIVTAVLGYWGQFGVLVSTESLAPSLDKLNPVNGVKQLFSLKKLGELGLSVVKAALLGLLIFLVVRSELPSIVALSNGTPRDVYVGFIDLLRSVLHPALGLCVALGVLDYALQKHFLTKSLMMDMEEIKREYKESEGDPMIKGQRKSLARQWAAEEPVAKTREANAVVVNPTHFAVAMYYDVASATVPKVLARGRDEVAQAMIAEARACGIPVIRHVWLARTLYASCAADTFVPKASYQAVAHVYAVALELLEQPLSGGRTAELERYGAAPEAE